MNFAPQSPYFKTKVDSAGYLEVWDQRSFPVLDDDAVIMLDRTYHLRPDLLAYDLYSDSRLWWVFAVRNPNVLINPLLDFVEGTQLWVPKIETLKKALGI